MVSLILPVGIQTTIELISGGVVSAPYVMIGLVLVGVIVAGAPAAGADEHGGVLATAGIRQGRF